MVGESRIFDSEAIFEVKQSKLLLIEGIMGSGKTSTAQFVADSLQSWNVETQLYLEGNLDHPADYEAVSYLGKDMVSDLFAKYPDYERVLKQNSIPDGDDLLVPYGKLGKQIPLALYEEIKQFDIYDGIPLEKHRELLLSRWSHFAEQQAHSETTTILECAFMQNPMCAFLAKHDAGTVAVRNHISQLAERVQPLDPLLIYFYQRDVRDTVERVSQVRSKEWLDFVIRYHTEQEYGKAHDLNGFEGLVQFLQMRQELEMDICKQLPFPTLIIDNSERNWATVLLQLKQELQNRFLR